MESGSKKSDGCQILRKCNLKIENSKLALIYSPPEGVPSMLASLTSVFGMGTGVPSLRKHQLRTFNYSILKLHFGNDLCETTVQRLLLC